MLMASPANGFLKRASPIHRQHNHLPEDFQNWRIKEIIDGKPVYYADGEQVDIPMSTWLDVRVEMPPNSVWPQKQHLVEHD